jgi:MarR family transcriptional regulator, organic hydroperoxide resistance regulator
MARERPPTVAAKAAQLGDVLCFAIYSANLAINRAYKPLLDELGLTYPQYLVLAALYEHDDQTVGSLGDELFLDSSTLTPLLKRMEGARYLTRQRDPQDERQVRIRLTQRGRHMLRSMSQQMALNGCASIARARPQSKEQRTTCARSEPYRV